MHDAARPLQFIQSKAAEWNIDRERIGASGTSAGACTGLWLALHTDMAAAKSSDAVARESTRLWCAAVTIAQTSLDPKQMKEWSPNIDYGGHAFGFWNPNNLKTRDTRFDEFFQHRDEIQSWIREYSPIEHVSGGDPPIYLLCNGLSAAGRPSNDPTRHAAFGVPPQEKLNGFGSVS